MPRVRRYRLPARGLRLNRGRTGPHAVVLGASAGPILAHVGRLQRGLGRRARAQDVGGGDGSG